jgi:CxxC motif-containing protein (DUF1111 family)
MLIARRADQRRFSTTILAALLISGCQLLTTEAPDDNDLFDAPVPGLTAAEMATFARGDAEFGRPFAPATGLGPLFNDISCVACHSGDGRGGPANILSRFGTAGDGQGGPQLQDRAISGAVAERLPDGVAVSRRLPPPVFGVGLIEAIPEATIVARADPNDTNGDGISGRANRVTPASYVPAAEPGGGGQQAGRFGRKAQVTSLVEQVVGAYHQDMGITSPFIPTENTNPQVNATTSSADVVPDPEVPTATVMAVVNYLRMLAPPAPGADTPARVRGRELFSTVGCAACHVPELQTGRSAINALSNRTVALYSDLLLHDMGDGLADNRPDGQADGREWKTTPLWGLRIAREFLDGALYLMHDGSARTVEEAIEQHGGEGTQSRTRFRALSAEDRAALLDFVSSR